MDDDNQARGLKIAVALLVTLTVILAVTVYFLYSANSRSEALLQAEKEQVARLISAVKKSKPPLNSQHVEP